MSGHSPRVLCTTPGSWWTSTLHRVLLLYSAATRSMYNHFFNNRIFSNYCRSRSMCACQVLGCWSWWGGISHLFSKAKDERNSNFCSKVTAFWRIDHSWNIFYFELTRQITNAISDSNELNEWKMHSSSMNNNCFMAYLLQYFIKMQLTFLSFSTMCNAWQWQKNKQTLNMENFCIFTTIKKIFALMPYFNRIFV